MIQSDEEQLWKTFIELDGLYEGFYQEYRKVRNGIKIKFPIWWLWDRSNRIVKKYKEDKVFIKGKKYDGEEFEEEKVLRKFNLVKSLLILLSKR